MDVRIEDHPEDWNDLGYLEVRRLPNGVVAAVGPLLFTIGLFVGVGEEGYGHRYCYTSLPEALIALRYWDGAGHPPGRWIVRKPGDLLNPILTEEATP